MAYKPIPKKNFPTRGEVSIFSNTFFKTICRHSEKMYYVKPKVATSLSEFCFALFFEAIIDLARNNVR